MKHTILLLAIMVFLIYASPAHAFDFLLPTDPIIAIDTDAPTSTSNYPAPNETPLKAIDGITLQTPGNKYLNFGKLFTGIIVTPSSSSTVQSIRTWTANDATERDPTSFEIWGTNSAILSADNSTGLAEPWSFIGEGLLAPPTARGAVSPSVNFTNSTAYSSYKVIFPTVRNAAGNSMQVGEIELFTGTNGTGTDVLTAGLPIRAMQVTYKSSTPALEGAVNAIDQSGATKYLNFGKENTGFIVTPSFGAAVLNRFQITTANDTEGRDPASWVLYGTNAAVQSRNNSTGDGEAWTLIDSGTITLPAGRNTVGPEITVANTNAYTAYKMVFPTLKDSATVNSMQFSEIVFRAPDDVVLQINRQTGVATFNATATTSFKSYQIVSPNNGGLNDAAWTSISATNADGNDTWSKTSPPGNVYIVSEADDVGGANDGFTIATGNNYNLGNIWRILPTAFEDVTVAATRPNGAAAPFGVQFIGTEVPMGDYSGNGTVGIEDWPTFRAGYGGDYTGLSRAQAYLGGDLDGDFDSDINDFNLFVDAAGGAGALFGSGVPEPTSLFLVFSAIVGVLSQRKRRTARVAAAAVGFAMLAGAGEVQAQTFTNSTLTAPTTSIPAGQQNETAGSGPEHFFDDTFLDSSPTAIDDEMFILDYNDPNLNCANCLQYQGLGEEPKTVFMDYGTPVSANWFAYAQRSGGDPTADRVGKFEFWFSNSDFGGVLPATPADAVVQIADTDARLRDSVLRPYSLSGDRTGQFVALRLTVSGLSEPRPTNNIGGHEFRLLQGPADVVLEVDRSNGAMTLKNNLTSAQAIEMKSYTIESAAGGLDSVGFNGLRGDSVDFPAGNGSGNGWELGGGSNSKRLAEAYFSGISTLAAGTAGLSLGNAYNEISNAEDLVFTWTNAAGEVYNSRVTYVGTAPGLQGDYNGNGVVDGADYVVWRNGGSPDSTQAGYNLWRAHFGESSGGGSGLAGGGAVPEPSTGMGILLIAMLGLGAHQRVDR